METFQLYRQGRPLGAPHCFTLDLNGHLRKLVTFRLASWTESFHEKIQAGYYNLTYSGEGQLP
jgi:hypothetical protein